MAPLPSDRLTAMAASQVPWVSNVDASLADLRTLKNGDDPNAPFPAHLAPETIKPKQWPLEGLHRLSWSGDGTAEEDVPVVRKRMVDIEEDIEDDHNSQSREQKWRLWKSIEDKQLSDITPPHSDMGYCSSIRANNVIYSECNTRERSISDRLNADSEDNLEDKALADAYRYISMEHMELDKNRKLSRSRSEYLMTQDNVEHKTQSTVSKRHIVQDEIKNQQAGRIIPETRTKIRELPPFHYGMGMPHNYRGFVQVPLPATQQQQLLPTVFTYPSYPKPLETECLAGLTSPSICREIPYSPQVSPANGYLPSWLPSQQLGLLDDHHTGASGGSGTELDPERDLEANSTGDSETVSERDFKLPTSSQPGSAFVKTPPSTSHWQKPPYQNTDDSAKSPLSPNQVQSYPVVPPPLVHESPRVSEVYHKTSYPRGYTSSRKNSLEKNYTRATIESDDSDAD